MLAAVNLGEILWTLLVIYLMVMYFVVVITVILDIFRSDDLSGVWKAIWSVALILFPFVALVIYLIARGDGIGMRNLARSERSQAETDAYVRSLAAPPSGGAQAGGPASELEKAKGLADAGAITDAEYQQLKAKLLA